MARVGGGRWEDWRAQTRPYFSREKIALWVNADCMDDTVKPPSTRNWREISILCLLGSVLFYVFSRTSADPDLWGHVRFGRDLWETGRIVREDIYSYLTGDQLWINHEWLSEAIFYFAFATAGSAGLIAFKSGLALLIVAFLYWHLRQQIPVALHAAILTGVFSLSLIPYLAIVRPQAFTFLIFLLVLIVVRRAEHGEMRWLWMGPPLLAFAVNVHGGVLAAGGVFLLWLLLHLSAAVFRERSLTVIGIGSNRVIIGVALAAVAAMLLNPYGIQLLFFLLRTATVPRPEIAEWQPITLISAEGLVYVLFLVLALTGLIFSRRQRSPVLVALFACTAFLPLIATRHMPLFGLACAILIAEHVADVWQRMLPPGLVSGPDAAHGSWLVASSLITALVIAGFSLSNFQCIRIDRRRTEFPVKAVALLKQSNVAGNMAVHFDWGEYVLWHLGPQIKVSIDGRRETVYSRRPYAENLLFISGLGDWDGILKKSETHLALVSKAFPVFNLMNLKPGWTLVYEDPMSGIFVRQGSALEDKLRLIQEPGTSHNGAGLCFP
jgi:hypothetical protein